MTEAKKAKRPGLTKRQSEMIDQAFADGKTAGFQHGYNNAKADFKDEAERLKRLEREQMFKALASLGRIADQMACTAEGIAKIVLSLNGHL